MLGLYIHIPFCSAICNYCNFNRGLFDAALKGRYVEALVREIASAGGERLRDDEERGPASAERRLRPARGERVFERRSASEGGWGPASTEKRLRPARGERVFERRSASERGWGPASTEKSREAADTIYFGGGTPSLLEPEEIARIVETCRTVFEVSSNCEVTLEANPESVTGDRLAAFRAAGVNRLSFGVQSFRDEELGRLSRLHNSARARDAYAEARAVGFDNVSLDLMMWLPGQRIEDWLQSVDAAIALAPDHVSLYLLEVYPNAPLKEEMARSRWSQAPDDDAAAMYVEAMERLEAAGLEQYEISNVARAGRRARHNVKYWNDDEWLGFGCGAHSTRDGIRWKNVSATEEYVGRIGRGETTMVDVRRMSREERLGDALFTGLRLVEGVDEDRMARRYGVDIWQRYGSQLEPFLESGVLLRMGGRLRLTRRGMLVAHEVMLVFV